ncbi:MAG: amidohydrolase [Asticcacaulis sp.]|uniref:amidohydrolase n=1 Tax=Asticcacaulis sp. TaxID=1872648 RepID=UPI0039E393B3
MRRLLAVPLLAAFFCTTMADAAPADQVFVNARIYTADTARPWASALAITDGRISAVGAREAVAGQIGPGTRLTDLHGAMLMPGLIDSHAHPIAGGRQMSLVNLDGAPISFRDFRAFVDHAIFSRKALQGDRFVIVGVPPMIWSEDLSVFNAPPYAGKAILFAGADAHTGWASQTLLRRLGIDKAALTAMPETERNYYRTDADGNPTGFAVETGASRLFRALPGRDGAYLPQWGRIAVRYYNSFGVTAVLDANAGYVPEDGEALLKLYSGLAKTKQLTLHVSALLEARSTAELPEIYRLRAKYSNTPDFRIVGVKLFADGIVDYPAQTAATLKPYLNSGLRGDLKIAPDEMDRIFVDADKHDMLVHVHAIGDRAVEEALDGIAAARSADPNSHIPHTLAHLHLIAPKDVPRFQSLGAIASFQLFWAAVDKSEFEGIKPYLSPDVWNEQYAAYSVFKAGGTVAGGSDWPVSTGSPWAAIAQAMTREGPYGVLGSDQRMPLEAMLQAYTLNAAHALRREDQIGSIAVGKEADLILLRHDLRDLTPAEIANLRPEWTMMHGRIVWSSGYGPEHHHKRMDGHPSARTSPQPRLKDDGTQPRP